ncbi:uncharacterized protein K441DRAFT_653306 [Cenococcum geophilum 1.58]|uniref:uncharacterized protein n=1 Tax=Cenococcum geophilum 1.58 TaxID=794803 RepID=UPI00358E21CC|nr:hypothetical protein K441DRAFT_653306 [Cenococcum geophilum 1.58]
MGLGLGLEVLVSISALVEYLGFGAGLHGILGQGIGTENYDLGTLGRLDHAYQVLRDGLKDVPSPGDVLKVGPCAEHQTESK